MENDNLYVKILGASPAVGYGFNIDNGNTVSSPALIDLLSYTIDKHLV